MNKLEHVNFTVRDPQKTAAWMVDVFGWHIRWQGPAMDGAGYSVHVGTDQSYVALYAEKETAPRPRSYATAGGLNHVAVVVDDFAAVKAKVKTHFEPGPIQNYEPGQRFYFFDDNQIEFEVVCYA